MHIKKLLHASHLLCKLFESTIRSTRRLLMWPYMDEGDLMDEEFDSESDA